MHVSLVVAAKMVLAVPAGHLRQTVFPVSSPYVPGPQASHTLAEVAADTLLALPAGHGVHAPLAVPAYVPRAHWVQARAPALDAVPAAQGEQEAVPGSAAK